MISIYFRLLKFIQPANAILVLYTFLTALGIVFGVVNFALIIPLLNILFGAIQEAELQKLLIEPTFQATPEYVYALFNHHFAKIIVANGQYAALQYVCVVLIVSIFFSNGFRFLAQTQMETLKAQFIKNVRGAIFSKMMRLHLGFFSSERKGDLMSRITNDLSEVDYSVNQSVSIFLKEPISLFVYFFALLSISVKLTLFTLIVIPVAGVLIAYFVKRLRQVAYESSVANDRMMSALDESLHGIKIIKGYAAENYTNQKFEVLNSSQVNINKKIAIKRELASPFSEFSGVLVVCFILLYGGSLVLGTPQELSSSAFIGYIALFSQILKPAKSLTSAFTAVQKGIISGQRIFEFLDTPEVVSNAPNAQKVESFRGALRFEKVGFSYGSKKILDQIDFELEKGKIIALVGPSGGGKSTIADLVSRFYDPQEGRITMDGIDIRNIEMESFRNQIGIVTQEPILFNDTIYNNLCFNTKNVSKEMVEHAAKMAQAHDFIMQTENGYETSIGDRGVKLSGGQRQRLSIARAILKNPSILVLDEATSALDTESEKLVQKALEELMKNRTSLVIAHRLSTIQYADEILVIKQGKIIERGNHQTLMNLEQGVYQKLIKMQSI